jgi:prefoldin subunit 5
MKMTKDEVIENLEKAIDSYDKLIDANLESIGILTRRIELLKGDNAKNLQKMREFSVKLRELKEE